MIKVLAKKCWCCFLLAGSLQAYPQGQVAGIKAAFPIGRWRGVFEVRNKVEIPFNFEIAEQQGEMKAWLLNGEERFAAGAVRKTDDSLFILLDQFDNELAFKIENGQAQGVLRRQDKTVIASSVSAQYGRTDRFTATEIPLADVSGTYDVTLKEEDGSETKTVGLFTQSGNRLKATFLEISGDSRFLEGVISGNTVFLSSFIGSSPSYYTATVIADGKISGLISNLRSDQPFSGVKNSSATMPDPYSLTHLKPGYNSFDFSFPDLDGKRFSLKDEKYRGKVVVITITGTWCPNCIDEAAFLSSWYKQNKQRGVEAIALHYERSIDPAYLRKVIGRFRERYGIEYKELVGGTTSQVSESLPALSNFLAFPTILFIDKKGNVAKIYTGFSGPATGKYYEQFQNDFNAEIDRLLKQ